MPIIRQGGPAGKRGPSYGKSLYLYPKDGQLVAAAWPKKPKVQPSAAVLANRARFAQAQKLIPHIYPGDMLTAIEAVKDTFFLPRDLITAAMYGRSFSIAVQGQRMLVPMAFRKDVSFSLDTIGDQPGEMIFRGSALWESFPSGRPGQVLFSKGPLVAPGWESLPPLKDLTMLTSSPLDQIVSDAMALQGNFFGAGFNIFVTAIYSVIDLIDTGVYVPIIARMDGEDIAEILYRGPQFLATATGKDIVTWPLAAPITLLQGQPYIAAVYRQDATAATNIEMWEGTSDLRGWPWKGLLTAVRAANNDPQVGDTVDLFGTPDIRSCHLVYQI